MCSSDLKETCFTHGHTKSPSPQSQQVICYMHDPKSGSIDSLHVPEHPHLGKDSVPAHYRAHLQTLSPHVFLSVTAHCRTFLPRVIFTSSSPTSSPMICWQHKQDQPGADQGPNPPMSIQELQHQSTPVCRPKANPHQQSCSILGHCGLTAS